eukprot:5872815-Amphidinium_carterae.2
MVGTCLTACKARDKHVPGTPSAVCWETNGVSPSVDIHCVSARRVCQVAVGSALAKKSNNAMVWSSAESKGHGR